MRTYTQLLNDLNVKIQNQANSIPVSVRTFINQVLREEVGSFDYVSTMRHTSAYQAVYDDVNRYALPSDMKSEALVNIQKYLNFTKASGDKYRKVSPNVFKTMFERNTLAFDYSDGLSWLLANIDITNKTSVLASLDNLTSEGTWTASDNSENIEANSVNYIAGSGSVSCDLASAGTTLSIVNSTLTPVDMTSVVNRFLWVYLPTTQNLSSITLLYGSSASAYYSKTVTTPFDVTEFKQGWNLVAFGDGTATGSPDITAIDYIKISLNFSSTPTVLTGFLFDSLMYSKGEPIEITYYSKHPWQTASGTMLLDSTTNDDLLNATEEEYSVWLAKCAYEASMAIPMSSEQIQIKRADYLEKKNEYKMKFPSRRIKEQNYLYRPTINVNKKFIRNTNFDDISNSI